MLFLRQPGQDGDVRLAERQPRQVPPLDPAHLLAGERARLLAGVQGAPVERQLDLQVGIDVLDARVLLADGSAHPQLLAQLARQRGALALVRLDLSARKFPERGALALGAPERDQHFAVAFDHRRDHQNAAERAHGSNPREKRAPALETMYATPGSTKAGCENPLPGSKAPRASPVSRSTPKSGPRSLATITSPRDATGWVGYRSRPSCRVQSFLPFARSTATSCPWPPPITRRPSTSTWFAPGSGKVQICSPVRPSSATRPAFALAT